VPIVQFHLLDLFIYLRMIFQYHYVLWHEPFVQPFRHADRLLCGEMRGLRDYAQHVLLVEVEVPDHAVYGSPVRDGIQLDIFHLVVHDGLLCERTWW